MTALAINHDALKGGTHPTRAVILELLDAAADTPDPRRTPKQFAQAAGIDVATISHHVKMLVGYELIEPKGTTRRRGATVHFYTITPAGRTAHRAARTAAGESRLLAGLDSAIALAEHLSAYAPDGERARYAKQIADLRAIANGEWRAP